MSGVRCVFCVANLPHARHMSTLEAARAGITLVTVSDAGIACATVESSVTPVTSEEAPSAPKE